MASILDEIGVYKREEIAAARRVRPLADVEAAARVAPPVRGFREALAKAITAGRYGLIAEIKKASPSKGLIRDAFNPSELAQAYEAGGATCLSVLTDEPSFRGKPEYLTQARAAVSLPVIRKDFMYDPYQVPESRALGADCILIIMSAVDDGAAAELEAAAVDWGMDALLEIHDEAQLDRALKLRSRLIGINNRDLNTFTTTLEPTERLAPLVPKDRLVVGESGIRSPADLARLSQAGVNCFLVGESLMREPDVEAATRALLAREPSHV